MRHTCAAFLLVLTAVAACSSERRAPSQPVTVFAAASLARPLGVVSDSIERRSGARPLVELGGSMEQARKITELARVPDVILLVDDDVIASLMPAHLDWYVRFATNQIVVTYTDKSPGADSITTENWWRVLSRPNIRIGRADPTTAPVGRHALAMLDRVDGYYNRRGVGETLKSRAGQRFIRPNATELAALLETGEVDYMLDYESVARQYGFKFVSLPADLSPLVLYGVSVPRLAPHPSDAIAYVEFLLSPAGRRVLRDAQIQLLPTPVAIGDRIPSPITELVRTTSIP